MLYAPEEDRRGRELLPGDRVRFKLYPRGTAEGTVVISRRSMVVMPGGGTLPALAIETDDGTTYALYSGGTTKVIQRQASTRLTPPRFAVLCLIAEGRPLSDYMPAQRPGKHRGFGAFPVTTAERAADWLFANEYIRRGERGLEPTELGQRTLKG